MANCPECGKEMVKSETKKKGMFVLKHKNAEDQNNCDVKFIPMHPRKAANDGGKKEGQVQAQNQPSEYAAAVAAGAGASTGKTKSPGKGKKHVQQQPAVQRTATSTQTDDGGSKRAESYRNFLKNQYGI